MKQNRKAAFLLAMGFAFLLPATMIAQKEEKADKEKEKNKVEQVIITKKGDSKDKVVVEIIGDKVTINGKEVEEYKDKDGNVTIIRTRPGRGVQMWNDMGFTPGLRSRGGNSADAFELFNENSNKAMLGVTTEKTEEGVEVKSVTEESAAEKMGLKEGDIITKVDGKDISSPDQLSEIIQAHKPGDKVKVTYKRGKKTQTEIAELTKWKGINSWSGNFNFGNNFNMDDLHLDKIMPKIQTIPRMSEPFGQYFGIAGNRPKLGLTVQDTDDGKGVKVLEVDEESNAAKAGVKEGDIITEADGRAINGTDDMVKMVRENKDKVSVMLKLNRDGKTQNIEVKMPRLLKKADL